MRKYLAVHYDVNPMNGEESDPRASVWAMTERDKNALMEKQKGSMSHTVYVKLERVNKALKEEPFPLSEISEAIVKRIIKKNMGGV
jgi:hypothetical protein